ncbi:MAG: Gfo/Idh/MocA family oxidoreductase [Herpetosiphonaceae bacterium]|nr:Gfo/Idh/MocA family oxidoreductase [Herpetosiphonaceae bacterium]
MQSINLGILGAGLAVKHLHWPALHHLAGMFTITAVCDIDLTAAQEIARLVGGDPVVTTDWDEFFGNSQLEAVLISLPIHLNAAAIRAAVRAGKHVICEKPLAASLAQAEDLVAELRDAPVVIEIAENFHYRSDFKQARRWIEEGAIGTVVIINIIAAFWSDPTEGFASTAWRQDHQYRGAVIADAGVHQVAALREVGGEVEQLHAFTKDVHPVLAGSDSLVLNVRFRSGALGQLLFSGAVQAAEPSFDAITALGLEGTITVRHGVATLHRPNRENVEYRAEDARGYIGEFHNFYHAIRSNEPVVATLDEALADWRIIMGALDSAESRQVVLL